MEPLKHPPIEARQATDLLAEMIKRIPTCYPEWKSAQEIPPDVLSLADDTRDFGMALLKLAAHMGQVIAGQVNRIPDKNFLAFLDFVGIDLSPPKSARAPLTFCLSDKAPDNGFVPKGTQVGAVKREDVIFETDEDLLVSRAALLGAYSVDPGKDRYLDLSAVVFAPSANSMNVFSDSGTSPAWLPNEHALYLGHDILFSQAAEAGDHLSIVFEMATGDTLPALVWEYSTADGWQPAVDPLTTPTGQELKTPGIAKRAVEGHDDSGNAISRISYWLRAKTTDPKPLTISKVEVTVSIDNRSVPMYKAIFNNITVDISKDFLPFGERPKFNDTFYIASAPAFSGPSATVMITTVLSRAVITRTDVGLDWEYWDGTSWQLIAHTTQTGVPGPIAEYGFSDTTNAFTQNGSIGFTCPDMQPTSVNGDVDYWIRIRIVTGDYGKEATYQATANDAMKAELGKIETDAANYKKIIDLLTQYGLVDTYQYVAATFDPPSIKSLRLSYSLTTTTKTMMRLTNNGLVYRDVSSVAEFQPFFRWDDKVPVLYLEFDSVTAIPGTPLSVHLQVVQPVYGARTNAVGSDAPPAVVWWYWNGTDWTRLPSEDETDNLTRSGLLRFIVPVDAADRYLFGNQRLWLRASLESGGYRAPPRLEGITLNTVWASHGITFKDQILGSSNGDPKQAFQYPKFPVLTGQLVEIREPTLPTDADRALIVAAEGPDAIRTVNDTAGNITEVWVRWHDVAALSLSTAADRHYLLDRASGRLMFGDGVQGRIPPAGKTNIVARTYRAGGGTKGLCAKLTLTELKTTLPLIDKVTNYESSAGAADQENIDNVAMSGPLRIKSRDRAVTVEDYEWLAREAATEVAKSRCLALTSADSLLAANPPGNDPGWLTVIVVPGGHEAQPLPTEGLINTVKDYLGQRSLPTLATRIDVIGPRYVSVDVSAEVVPRRMAEAKTVEKRVFDQLTAFLHPLSGGPDGNGWEFGRDIYLSEIAAVVQATEGVDRVRSLIVRKTGDVVPSANQIAIGGNDLPAAGNLTVLATEA